MGERRGGSCAWRSRFLGEDDSSDPGWQEPRKGWKASTKCAGCSDVGLGSWGCGGLTKGRGSTGGFGSSAVRGEERV